MSIIRVMINGLPGNVATVIARHFLTDRRFKVLPYALTGPDIDAQEVLVDTLSIELIRPEAQEARMAAILGDHAPFISVDFTHPTAVNANADFYGRHQLPFVMGTTGGDRERLLTSVVESGNVAVIAPNMTKQIVGFQAMMAYAADNFPNLFKGYRLTIRESHQAGKADTSGTAKAMVTYFNRMGIPFGADQIEKERDPERQLNLWGIPPAYLAGHAWHTYALVSPDQTVRFEFTHNINGREVYGDGTKDAVCFLADKVAQGIRGKAFSMIDVLKAGAELASIA
jgi:4-hydroxy-tetrahydrodipicolinate reductase